MGKLFYCLQCKRVFKDGEKCSYCGSEEIKELQKNSPINILGTKQKGKVLKIEEEKVKIILINENKERLIKEYTPEKLKKVL